MYKMYHVFSEGNNVLFRDDSDYIQFNNKFAIICNMLGIKPLAETTMSTHFHALIEIADELVLIDFKSQLRKSYLIYYYGKYDFSLSSYFIIKSIEVKGIDHAKKELLYILKNPVHHYVMQYPLKYRYSSAFYIFMDKLLPENLLQKLLGLIKKVNELTSRERKKILGKNHNLVPNNWLVSADNMILPLSYININRSRAFWGGNVKSFLYDINLNQTDAAKEIIDSDLLDLRSSSKNDIEVCSIIDKFCIELGFCSLHKLNKESIQLLYNNLKQLSISHEQLSRCLWLK